MFKRNLFSSLLVVLCVLAVGCTTMPMQSHHMKEASGTQLDPGNYIQKVESFLVILDASASMSEDAKLAKAKDFLHRMNRTLPDLEYQAALRKFGQPFPIVTRKTELIYGPTEYTKKGLKKALRSVCLAAGNSPLALALDAADEDLQLVPGNIAVIVVSDGKEMDDSPVEAADRLARLYKDRLCIYTVQIGSDPVGGSLLGRVARTTPCGFSVAAEDVSSEPEMAEFVMEVFFGVSRDSDRDGVTNDRDRCPNTPRGAKVDERGCWVVEVRFDSGKWDIKYEYYSVLNEAALVLEKNPGVKVEIQGHTDIVGNAQFNQRLSEKRAKSVMDYLAAHGVDKSQLSAKGYGSSRPIASNKTPEGRAKNRRIELKVLE